MKRAALAGRCRDLLGALAGPVLVAEAGHGWLATALAAEGCAVVAAPPLAVADWDPPATPVRGAVLSFLGFAGGPAERQARLAVLRRRLRAGAPLVLVDHNQPRRLVRRLGAAVGLLVRGMPPRRARYPVAREAQALGFVVRRLRFAAGERVQLVRVDVPEPAGGGDAPSAPQVVHASR